MRSSYNSIGSVTILTFKYFCSSHIDEINFSLIVDNRVLRFDITVDNISGMEILNRKDKRSKIEFSYNFVQNANLSDGLEHLYSINILKQKVDIGFVLISFVIPHNQWMAETC